MSVGDYAIQEIDEGEKDPLRIYRQMSSTKERKREREREEKKEREQIGTYTDS
jgi:hypothetical protein